MRGDKFLALVAALVLGVLLLFGYAVFGGSGAAPYEGKGTTNLDALALDSSLSAGTYITAGTWYEAQPQAATAITDTVLTLGGTYNRVTPSCDCATIYLADSGVQITAGTRSGQLAIVENVGATASIVISNSLGVAASGDITLGPGDTIGLVWDGYNAVWRQLFTTDN